jgi:hypothetical protein
LVAKTSLQRRQRLKKERKEKKKKYRIPKRQTEKTTEPTESSKPKPKLIKKQNKISFRRTITSSSKRDRTHSNERKITRREDQRVEEEEERRGKKSVGVGAPQTLTYNLTRVPFCFTSGTVLQLGRNLPNQLGTYTK